MKNVNECTEKQIMPVRFELYMFLLNGTNANSIKYNGPCLNSHKEYSAVQEGGVRFEIGPVIC